MKLMTRHSALLAAPLALWCTLAQTPGQDYVSTVTNTPNLLGYWRFDSAFQANSCVNGYTGTLQGNAQIGPPGPGCPLSTSDPAAHALLLDGINSYLSTSLSGQITNQGTMMAWVYLTAQPSAAGHFFQIISQSEFANDFDLQIETNNSTDFYTDTGTATTYAGPLPINQWEFLAATFIANSNRCIYLNGQLVASSTAGGHSVNNTAFWFGNTPVFGPRMFQGQLGEVAIFNRALAASEVEAIYSAAVFSFTTNSGAITITGYNPGAPANMVIPATINGYPVTSIGNAAFLDNDGIASATIPDGVTSIGDGAFDSDVNLTNVTIPASLTNLGNYVFLYCSSLESVTIPNGVSSIGTDAFAGCDQLATVTFPNSMTSIGDGAFEGCYSLTSVAIPNGVTSIGTSAFFACDLATVTVPGSVTSIGDEAFAGCYSLTSAYFLGNAPPDDGTVFTSGPATADPATVYFLPGTTGWGPMFGGVPTELWNPQASALSITDGQFGFNLAGPAGAAIVVEACTNLSDPVWEPVTTNTLSPSGTGSFTDPQSGEYPVRFYRFTAP